MTLRTSISSAQPLPSLTGGVGGGSNPIMNEAKKKIIKRVIDIVITILTALATAVGAHAAGIVQ